MSPFQNKGLVLSMDSEDQARPWPFANVFHRCCIESLLTAQEEIGDCHRKTWNYHPDVDLSSSDNVAVPHPGFPDSSAGKESARNVGDLGLILGLGRSPGKGKGYPLQYSGLETSMDFIVHGVAKSRTQLRAFHSLHHPSKFWPRLFSPIGTGTCNMCNGR